MIKFKNYKIQKPKINFSKTYHFPFFKDSSAFADHGTPPHSRSPRHFHPTSSLHPPTHPFHSFHLRCRGILFRPPRLKSQGKTEDSSASVFHRRSRTGECEHQKPRGNLKNLGAVKALVLGEFLGKV